MYFICCYSFRIQNSFILLFSSGKFLCSLGWSNDIWMPLIWPSTTVVLCLLLVWLKLFFSIWLLAYMYWSFMWMLKLNLWMIMILVWIKFMIEMITKKFDVIFKFKIFEIKLIKIFQTLISKSLQIKWMFLWDEFNDVKSILILQVLMSQNQVVNLEILWYYLMDQMIY